MGWGGGGGGEGGERIVLVMYWGEVIGSGCLKSIRHGPGSLRRVGQNSLISL